MKRSLLLICAICVCLTTWAQETASTTPTPEITTDSAAADSAPKAFELAADDPVVVALDSLLHATWFQPINMDSNALNVHGFPFDSVPEYTAEVYKERMEQLDANTPFSLVYNERVKAFIHLYAKRKRALTSKVLGLSHQYFPLFEEVLDKHEMPLELKYLAVVESALNPTARSRAGAKGLWQFMYRTGRMYGLEVSSYVDDRSDPYLATEAACKYLKFLHGMYDDWNLALAAYNCGPGNVNRAIRRSGGKKNYWDLWPYLPRETRGYVPAFIAVNYVMNYSAEHNLYPRPPQITYFEYDTVMVTEGVTFDQLVATLDVDKKLVQYLNPTYRRNVIPRSSKGRVLALPHEKMGQFLQNREQVVAYRAPGEPEKVSTAPPDVTEMRQTHIVRRGEYLGAIAKRYGVSVSNLKAWNSLRSTRINPGQRLVVYAPGKAPATRTKPAPRPKETEGKYVYYRIQRGDTLWDISKREGVSLAELKRLNGNLNSRRLKPGARIIVGTGS